MAAATLRRHDGFPGRADDVYEALIAAHEGLSEAESAALNGRLVLLLANHVGDLGVVREALHLARASLREGRWEEASTASGTVGGLRPSCRTAHPGDEPPRAG